MLIKSWSKTVDYRRGGIRFLYYKNKASLISIRYRKTTRMEKISKKTIPVLLLFERQWITAKMNAQWTMMGGRLMGQDSPTNPRDKPNYL
jgi:hypothetical protein